MERIGDTAALKFNWRQERALRRLVTVLALILVGAGAARAEPLFLDFERGRMGKWSFPAGSFAADSLGVELSDPGKNNRSSGALHCFVREGLPCGSARFVLRENGVSPIRVTPRTRVAWCWKAAANEDDNGFWLHFNMRNVKTGESESARFVTSIKNSHSVIRAYYEHDRVWVYHAEALYDYLWRRYPPAAVDSFVIESVELVASMAPNLRAWIDNIWIGESDPPDSVNVVETMRTDFPESSKLKGFSYGFLDGNWIPDRVDIYRDRAEILIDPHAGDGRSPAGGASAGPAVRAKEVEPFQKIAFDPQRIDGVASIADLDGNGREDILFGFDDVLGQRCFRGGAPGTRFREAPLAGGALFLDQEHSYGAAVSDVDRDGDLDVLHVNPFMRRHNFGGIRLVRNKGDWDFADGTVDSRILSQWAFGCAFGDVNGDGCPDLFAGYRWYYDPDLVASVNHLYLNDGGGRFIASPDALVIPGCLHLAGGVFADIDNDGDLDLYAVAGESRRPRCESPRDMLFLNDGTGRFAEAAAGCGIERADSGGTALAEDFDNDGFVDLYVAGSGGGAFYRNRGDGRFEAVEDELTCGEPCFGAVAADLDADGDMDIAILGGDRSDPICIENRNADGRNFVEVRLRGASGNRAGVGAKVYAYESGCSGERNRLVGFREINPARGFRRYAPPIAHFGLGSREKVDIEVVFPSVRGRDPVVVRERGVRGGSFIEISEHRNDFVRALSDAFHGGRDAVEGDLFRIPAWLAAALALASIGAAGSLVRRRAASSVRNAIDALLLAAMAAAAGLAVYRSAAWGAGALALAALVLAFHDRIEGAIRSLLQSKSWRDSAREYLLEELSEAIHTRKKFAFLMEIVLPDERGARAPARTYDSDFESLRKLVWTMRLVTPRDRRWRQAGAEIETVRKILGEVRKLGQSDRDAGRFEISERIVELQHATVRLNTLLRDYRASLHRTLSVSFVEEWRGVRREYDPTQDAGAFAIEEALPAGIGGVRIHLKQSEFRHIFKNLFDNSIAAMRDADEKRIRLAATLDSAHVTVTWTDTGPGVPKDLAGRLFREVVPSSRAEGKGEGCAITGRIVNRRQGVVRLEERTKERGAVIVMKFLRIT
jgi:signal transduction histidine kinase